MQLVYLSIPIDDVTYHEKRTKILIAAHCDRRMIKQKIFEIMERRARQQVDAQNIYK